MAIDWKKYKPILRYHRLIVLSIIFTYLVVRYNMNTSSDYYENGQIKHDGKNEGGFNEGRWIWFYPNGNRQMEGYFKKGKRVGKWKIYDEQEKLMSERNYEEDKLNGEASDYYTNGILKMKGYFQNDVLTTQLNYDENGNEIKKQ